MVLFFMLTTFLSLENNGNRYISNNRINFFCYYS